MLLLATAYTIGFRMLIACYGYGLLTPFSFSFQVLSKCI